MTRGVDIVTNRDTAVAMLSIRCQPQRHRCLIARASKIWSRECRGRLRIQIRRGRCPENDTGQASRIDCRRDGADGSEPVTTHAPGADTRRQDSKSRAQRERFFFLGNFEILQNRDKFDKRIALLDCNSVALQL